MRIAYRDKTGVVIVSEVSTFIFLEGKCYFETVNDDFTNKDYCINVNQIVQIIK